MVVNNSFKRENRLTIHTEKPKGCLEKIAIDKRPLLLKLIFFIYLIIILIIRNAKVFVDGSW